MKTGSRSRSATRTAALALLPLLVSLAGSACASKQNKSSSVAQPVGAGQVTPSNSSTRQAASEPTRTVASKSPAAQTQPATPPAPEAPKSPEPPVPPPAPAPPAPPTPPTTGTRDFATGVRVNVTEGFVEFDATVPLNARDPEKPRIYLELIACPPDTKEHEAVLLTKAKPSHVHAALLLLGLEPGSPGVWDWQGEKLNAIPPKGPRVKVTAYYTLNGKQVEANPTDWVIGAITRKTMTEAAGDDHWVFAGSQIYKRQGQDAYRADLDGTLIGLTTFGGETVAWTAMYNPDSGIEEPHWIANAATLPDYNTPVVVRISKDE